MEKKLICLASCPDTRGLEGFEDLINQYFYGKYWSVVVTDEGIHAVNTETGKTLPDDKIALRHNGSRYGIYARGRK